MGGDMACPIVDGYVKPRQKARSKGLKWWLDEDDD